MSANERHKTVPKYREKEVWICRDGKVPKSPEDGGPCSHTEESNFSDYETAKQTAEKHDLGVSIVFSDSNRLAGVDLDNSRDPETGETEEWAEYIIDTVASYTEISVSGTGHHILVEGALSSGQTNKADIESTLDAYDDAEVEMYDDVRHFSFTGNHVEGTPQTIEPRHKEILEIHEEYLANDDESEEIEVDLNSDPIELDDEPEDDEKLSDKELIEKIKDSNQGQKFKELFEQGSARSYGGDKNRRDQALMNILAYWTQKDPVRMERLFYQSNAWGNRDYNKWDGRKDYRERTIETALQSVDEVYEPKTTDNDSDEDTDTNIRKQNDGYYILKQSPDGDWYTEQITNFHIDVNAVLTPPKEQGDDSPKLSMTVKETETDYTYDVDVETSTFNEVRKFKRNVCTGLTSAYSGSVNDLTELRSHLIGQDAPHLQETTKIGLQDGEIVTKDGSVGTEEPEKKYVEQGIEMERRFDLDGLDYDKDEVREILELLPETREQDELIPVLGWWYSTLYTPYIREKTGEMPPLTVTGETESGKTSYFELLSQLFGLDPNGSSVDTTSFSLIRQFSATTNIPVWFDEYKPSELSNRQHNRFHSLLRKSTRAQIETRGNKDMSEDQYKLTSPVAITGEQQIQGNAEDRRSLSVRLSKTKDGIEEPFNKLMGNGLHDGYDLSEHTSAVYSILSEYDEDTIHEIWKSGKENIDETLEELGREDLSQSEINSLILIQIGIATYKTLVRRVGATDKIDQSDVDDAIEKHIAQSGRENRTSHIERYLLLIQACHKKGKLEKGHELQLIHTNSGGEPEQLGIKHRVCYPIVSKYIKEHDLDVDFFNDPDDYKSRFKDMAENDDSFVEDYNKKFADISRAVSVDIMEVEKQIEDFESRAFHG
jgi:primase-polymerase (primpol)-like protein